MPLLTEATGWVAILTNSRYFDQCGPCLLSELPHRMSRYDHSCSTPGHLILFVHLSFDLIGDGVKVIGHSVASIYLEHGLEI